MNDDANAATRLAFRQANKIRGKRRGARLSKMSDEYLGKKRKLLPTLPRVGRAGAESKVLPRASPSLAEGSRLAIRLGQVS